MGFGDKLKKFFSTGSALTELEGARPLSDAEKRGIVLGDIYASEGDLPANALTTGFKPRQVQKVLASAWDVSGPQDVDGAYAYLQNGGQRV